MVLLSMQAQQCVCVVVFFTHIRAMKQFKDFVFGAALGIIAPCLVVAGGTIVFFSLASLISQDQRAYNSCLFKHKSADYCRLIVSGR